MAHTDPNEPASDDDADLQQGRDDEEGEETQGLDDSPTLEDIAREQGWAPREEWRGDPAKWTSAAAYLRRGGEMLRERRNDRHEYDTRIKRMERVFKERSRREVEQRVADIERAKFAAAQEGDADRYEELTQHQANVLDEVEDDTDWDDPVTYAPIVESIVSDPSVRSFWESHEWLFDADDDDDEANDAVELALETATEMAKAGKGKAAQKAAAQRALREAYPHRYEDADTDRRGVPTRRPAPRMAAPGRAVQSSSLVDRVPAADRVQMRKDVAEFGMTPEEWAKLYFGEE